MGRSTICWQVERGASEGVVNAVKPVLTGKTYFDFTVDRGVFEGGECVSIAFNDDDVNGSEARRAEAAEMALSLVVESLVKKHAALSVLTLDTKTRAHLKANDPKALEQAEAAMGGA